MTILALQRRIQEAGRIRIGQQVATGNGGTRPVKLDTFRLTSSDKARIVQAAELFGGDPKEWNAPSGSQWEVVTQVTSIDVIVPPSEMSFSQYMELWSAGGCARRCDGQVEQISDGPCICDADEPECKPHTRLSVMIRDLSGLGVWRIDTQGWYAAQELEGAVQVIAAAAGAGTLLPARLRLEQRQVKRKDPNTGKSQTRNFPVPVLDIEVTPAQLLSGRMGGTALGGPGGDLHSLTTIVQNHPASETVDRERPALMTPVPATVQERPTVPVAKQATQIGSSSRKSRQTPIPSTGMAPRTAQQAAEQPDRQASQPKPSSADSGSLATLTVAQLKLRCRDAGLAVSGTKDELIARLVEPETSGSAHLPDEQKTGTGRHDEPEADAPSDNLPPDEPEPPRLNPQGPPTDAQRKKLFATLREHSISDQQRKAVITGKYQVDSLNDLTAKQVASLIDALETNEGAERFKAVADEWLASRTTEASDEHPDEDYDQQRPMSAAERAYAHAKGASSSIEDYQRRIRDAFKTLAVQNETVYQGGWERLQNITDGRASGTDWTGASEGRLRQLTEDLERAVKDLENGVAHG